MKKLTALLALALIAAFFYFDLKRYLTLTELKSHEATLKNFYQARPFATLAAYLTIYIVTTALSLPGATILTLAGAAILGFWPALIAVSFASSLGATSAFLLSRYFFRATAERRLGSRFDPINEGIRKDGAFYLLTLRLSPLFPFFIVNMALGLTSMPLRVFYLISQIGMLPGTIIYVNAGTRLGQLESLRDVLDWKMIASLTALGFFPLVMKRFLKPRASRAHR